MPRAHILIESDIQKSFRVDQVRGMFDVPDASKVTHEWDVNIPCEEKPWRIGLIVGPSGAGKTTIGKRLFPEAKFHEGYAWPENESIVDAFPKTLDAKTITKALSSVGFSSPPHWIKRFNHLSNGQRFRTELARMMLEDEKMIIFDEFTSIVDRDAAKISCAAVSKSIRAGTGPALVALSCHYDIVDWLNPDWVYDVPTNTFQWRCLRRHPEIELKVHASSWKDWYLFRGHHYLTGDINKAAQCFIATWNGKPVAFTSYLTFVHPHAKRTKRGHRTVVLPDYQGVGIGNRISEWMGSHLKAQGYTFFSRTAHPSMIQHRLKSKLWKLRAAGRVSSTGNKDHALKRTQSCSRLTASFYYVGP